ncbi:hypothetical protein QUF75_12490 [Desulfococcaceae bacterium HSG7]|nr:hypothetical protein [Desulfococcaceae bacterium HSG7]
MIETVGCVLRTKTRFIILSAIHAIHYIVDIANIDWCMECTLLASPNTLSGFMSRSRSLQLGRTAWRVYHTVAAMGCRRFVSTLQRDAQHERIEV